MPFYRHPSNFKPLGFIAAKKSVRNGLRHAIFNERGDKYVGMWRNDKEEGKGYSLTTTGKLYQGDWYKGYRQGFGILSHRIDTGSFNLDYKGEWVQNKPEGVGWRFYPNGDTYLGFWKRGKKCGFGNMWYADGTLYVGYWYADKKDGLGMFIQVNGNRYEGNWEQNHKHGRGRFYHMYTGQLQDGCWEHDICIKSKMSDITIRQSCLKPTEYPIPEIELKNPKQILENSSIWLSAEIGDIDKHLKFCIDQK